MTQSLAHLHIADATQAERIRSASGAIVNARRTPSRTSRGLRRLFPPLLQPRAAW